MKAISFILLILALVLKERFPLECLLIIQSALFLFNRNSPKLFFKRVVFVIPPLFGILILNPSFFPIFLCKSLTSLLAISVITANFDVGKISSVLKRFHIPDYLGEMFVLAFRYSHTFVDEVLLVKRNLWLRGSFAKKDIFKSSFLGPVVGHLFLRSLKKSEKIHQAMKLRGY